MVTKQQNWNNHIIDLKKVHIIYSIEKKYLWKDMGGMARQNSIFFPYSK